MAVAAAAATPPGQVKGSQLKVLVGKVMNSRSGYSSAGGS